MGPVRHTEHLRSRPSRSGSPTPDTLSLLPPRSAQTVSDPSGAVCSERTRAGAVAVSRSGHSETVHLACSGQRIRACQSANWRLSNPYSPQPACYLPPPQRSGSADCYPGAGCSIRWLPPESPSKCYRTHRSGSCQPQSRQQCCGLRW